MFIDVTRHGGNRVLRVAASAIAYLEPHLYGTLLHLVGGETLIVTEAPAEIEQRATPELAAAELICEPPVTADAIVEAFRRLSLIPEPEVDQGDNAPSSTPASDKRPMLKARR